MTPSPRQRGAKTWTVGHRRRLVINIGGQKFGSQILGGKNFGKICFQTTLSKNFEKIPFYSQKFLTTFFVIDNFFQKYTPSIQNLLQFLCIFLSLSTFLLFFMFLH